MSQTGLRFMTLLLLVAALAGAQETKASSASDSESSRPEYDALFTEILRSLPEESRAKVDSLKKLDRPAATAGSGQQASPEARNQALSEKRKQEIDGLPQEVKERVEKAISDLEERKKERQLEFKILEDQ